MSELTPERLDALETLDDAGTLTVRELRALIAAARELEGVRANYAQLCRDLTDDLDCLPECDSHGHADECPLTNPTAAFRALRARLAAYEKALQEACNCFRSISSSDGSGHADLATAVERIAGREFPGPQEGE